MPAEPAAKTLEELRSEVRASELIDFEVRGIKTRFFDQRGALAACHRAGTFYEYGMLVRIAELGRPGTYIDVGANIGNHTVFFAQHCPATVVHAFEPLDFVYAHLAEAVAVNGLTNVVLHQYGLGAKSGDVTICTGSDYYVIRCRRLDRIRIRGPVAVIKVDIEGMESAFIQGARRTLRRKRPVLYIEAQTETELASIEAALGRLSYRRTGRVFNATPTYEFARDGDPLLGPVPRRDWFGGRFVRRAKGWLAARIRALLR